MFAVVRFLDDFDGKRHVIPASDIKNLNPENDLGFDKYATYSAYWRDPVDDEDTGFYNVQIVMLAAQTQVAIDPESSDSDSDSLCAPSELKEMRENMETWKSRAQEYKEERDFLTGRVLTLERVLESENFESQAAAAPLAAGAPPSLCSSKEMWAVVRMSASVTVRSHSVIEVTPTVTEADTARGYPLNQWRVKQQGFS
ncbi:hypothetical protein HPB50_018777 [Hyalomma asiaticum]|uniref:Uncharacterized protein n=1 Tax=Hyalomma asiaticum TaxID=266040 RepID=A0ACB7SMN2_HYAAI|nr:hypothetical protein HPB50_018777 [Hyalomma asiaticum]